MTVLRVTVPDQYFCTKHPDLNITAREIKNQAGTDCPCLRRNIHFWALVKQIESVEKEFPQQHSPPSNFGTTPQKPYDALKCTALHDVLHFRSEGAAAGMSVHAQYNVIQFIWMNCVQCKAVPYTRVQWRKVYCSSATVHCTVYIIQLYTVVYSSIHTDSSTQHTVTVLAEWEPA